MTKEDIIRMAREAGIDIDAWEPLYEGDSAGFSVCECTHEELERFATLVASAEREACAKVCDEFLPLGNKCAYAIRARGSHD